MRKFIVHNRPLPGASKSSDLTILEVEGEVITAAQDVSVMWLSAGEYRFRITKPDFLLEAKDKAMVPPVYYSHSIYDSIDQARESAHRLIIQSFEFIQRKTGVSYDNEQVLAKTREVQQVLL